MPKLPLKNVRVLSPRPIGYSDEFSEKLIELGAVPVLFPLIQITEIGQDELKSKVAKNRYNWILFTSSVAVKTFFKSVAPEAIDSKIAVVGTSTKKEIEALGLKVSFMPSAATAKKLVKEIPLNKGESVLMPRSKIAGKSVVDVLVKRGMKVDELAIYDNTPIEYAKEEVEQLFEDKLNVISFTSASTANNFFAILQRHKIKLDGQHIASIGPSTTSAIKKLGKKVDMEAEEHNVQGLINVIRKMYE